MPRPKKCAAERNPPVTASPCQPPLGKGALRTGDADCEAGVRTGFAMTGYKSRGVWSAAGWRHPALRIS